MSEKKVTIEVDEEKLMRLFLNASGNFSIYPINERSTHGEYWQVEVSHRFMDNETKLNFALKKNGWTVREVTLSLWDIFNQSEAVRLLINDLYGRMGGKPKKDIVP